MPPRPPQTPAQAEQIRETVKLLEDLSPAQIHVIRAIIERFAGGYTGGHLRQDFMSSDAYEYFGMRLTAHHAYSFHMLKKENFEHILEQTFRLSGVPAYRQNSMTHRSADLMVGDRSLSLKTEAAQGIKADKITISKLMEAAWIKQITATSDIPRYIASMVLPHFANYDSIFMLRSYKIPGQARLVRYDLHEIPKGLLSRIGDLAADNFSPLTRTRTTSADVWLDGSVAFKFRLDGSDDKLTITGLDVRLCPLHAWWSLAIEV